MPALAPNRWNDALDLTAAVPAVAAAWSAALLAPLVGWSPAIASPVVGLAVLAAGIAVMRWASPEPTFMIAPFAPPTEQAELLLDALWQDADARADVLLLDQPLEVSLEPSMEALAELVLDDPLPEPEPDSRVVQLFAAPRIPTAGELALRIDRHLGFDGDAAPRQDAADSLRLALDELRRSLRPA